MVPVAGLLISLDGLPLDADFVVTNTRFRLLLLNAWGSGSSAWTRADRLNDMVANVDIKARTGYYLTVRLAELITEVLYDLQCE